MYINAVVICNVIIFPLVYKDIGMGCYIFVLLHLLLCLWLLSKLLTAVVGPMFCSSFALKSAEISFEAVSNVALNLVPLLLILVYSKGPLSRASWRCIVLLLLTFRLCSHFGAMLHPSFLPPHPVTTQTYKLTSCLVNV